MFFPVVIFMFIAVTTQVAVSGITLNDDINVEGEIFLEGNGCGILFCDGSQQKTGSLPSWDQKIIGGRFELVLENEAVLDHETGLVWQRTSDYLSARDWYSAQKYCYKLEIGGRKGWRLPTIDELATLVDSTQTNPSLPTGHLFVGTDAQLQSIYWSSTTRFTSGSTDNARIILFTDGTVSYFDKEESHIIYVRAVRSRHRQ